MASWYYYWQWISLLQFLIFPDQNPGLWNVNNVANCHKVLKKNWTPLEKTIRSRTMFWWLKSNSISVESRPQAHQWHSYPPRAMTNEWMDAFAALIAWLLVAYTQEMRSGRTKGDEESGRQWSVKIDPLPPKKMDACHWEYSMLTKG